MHKWVRMDLKSSFVILYLLMISVNLFAISECPHSISNLPTVHLKQKSLCEVFIRYQKLKAQWKKIDPTDSTQIVSIIAPRFISEKDWQASNLKGNYNPRLIYTPIPQTWDQWYEGAELINFVTGQPDRE